MPGRPGRDQTRAMNVIEVTDLVKRYGDRTAVDGVSFSVEEGEIFAILGPNGAGKTTTVESISGLRTPDSGSIRVASSWERSTSSRGKKRQSSFIPWRRRLPTTRPEGLSSCIASTGSTSRRRAPAAPSSL